MKTYLIKLGVCALAAISLFACKEDDPPVTPPVTPTLSISPSEATIEFIAAGEAKTVEVTTNQEEWNVTLTPEDGHEWLSVTNNEGSFTLTAAENTATTAPENVLITVTAGDAEPVTITASQAAFVPDPTLSTPFDSVGEVVFEHIGHGQDVRVTTNQGEWNVALTPTDGNGWLTIESKNNALFHLMAAKNTTPAERTPVTITITAGEAQPVTLTAKQQAGPPVLSTDASATITFLAEGGDNEVTVTTNYDTWNVVLDPANGNDWLTMTKGTGSFTLTAAENEEQAEPTPVTVTVTAGEATPVVITVKQDAADAPLVYYRIGDYWPDAANAEGVVWYIDPTSSTDGGATGLHGKVVSIDQSAGVEWVDGMHAYPAIATSTTDGKANTDAIVAHAQANGWTLATLGAMQWCLDKGEGWYIPAFEEHRACYAAMSGVDYSTITGWSNYVAMPDYNNAAYSAARTAFNQKFLDKGSSKLYDAWEYWWSSTQNASSFVWIFGNVTGSATEQSTGSIKKANVRAMKMF